MIRWFRKVCYYFCITENAWAPIDILFINIRHKFDFWISLTSNHPLFLIAWNIILRRYIFHHLFIILNDWIFNWNDYLVWFFETVWYDHNHMIHLCLICKSTHLSTSHCNGTPSLIISQLERMYIVKTRRKHIFCRYYILFAKVIRYR